MQVGETKTLIRWIAWNPQLKPLGQTGYHFQVEIIFCSLWLDVQSGGGYGSFGLTEFLATMGISWKYKKCFCWQSNMHNENKFITLTHTHTHIVAQYAMRTVIIYAITTLDGIRYYIVVVMLCYIVCTLVAQTWNLNILLL